MYINVVGGCDEDLLRCFGYTGTERGRKEGRGEVGYGRHTYILKLARQKLAESRMSGNNCDGQGSGRI